jgi:predicted transglutaminase-like protease
MQGIYIPETNCVPREYSVASILLLLFMVLISLVSVLNLLYFYISTFQSMCAVPNMAVFCSCLTSLFPGMLLTYFLNAFEIIIIIIIIKSLCT